MVSYTLITGYSILLFIFFVNLLAALNFANVFLKQKKRLEYKKRKNVFYIYVRDIVLATRKIAVINYDSLLIWRSAKPKWSQAFFFYLLT